MRPMRGAVAGAAVLEGWAADLAVTGGIDIAPNHHHARRGGEGDHGRARRRDRRDPPLVSGESGCAATAGLIAAALEPALREALGLDRGSRVVVIGAKARPTRLPSSAPSDDRRTMSPEHPEGRLLRTAWIAFLLACCSCVLKFRDSLTEMDSRFLPAFAGMTGNDGQLKSNAAR